MSGPHCGAGATTQNPWEQYVQELRLALEAGDPNHIIHEFDAVLQRTQAQGLFVYALSVCMDSGFFNRMTGSRVTDHIAEAVRDAFGMEAIRTAAKKRATKGHTGHPGPTIPDDAELNYIKAAFQGKNDTELMLVLCNAAGLDYP